jgi:serine/threonine protein phosphatase 1
MNKHLHLPKNEKGRDLIIGDLHGCYDRLWKLLEHIKYDVSVDRLLFVGDLVDRGPDNIKCLDMITMPGNYSVLGNHEDMMFNGILDRNFNMLDNWMYNGGNWARSAGYLDEYRLAFEAKLLAIRDKFPLVISVGSGQDRFNIVHAEFYSYDRPLSDENIDRWDFTPYEENNMIWGRTVVKYHNDSDKLFQFNMARTYCGHTPVRAVISVQSQIFIDTGCVYGQLRPGMNTDNGLTIVVHQEDRYYTLRADDVIETYDLPLIDA